MKKTIILFAIVIAAASCRKPYDPPAINGHTGYLVVEGVINAGSDSTIFKLSRSVSLDSVTGSKPELNAILTIQGDNNSSYPLTELGNGKYASPGLNLDNSHQYRLQIKAANSEVYLSSYLPVLNSPPIDSVSYDLKGALTVPGINIYVNTHDPTGKTLYYRWAFGETWKFHSFYPSYFYSNGDTVLLRTLPSQNVTDCWGHDTSSSILLGSSAKLSQDIIYKMPVVSIPSSAEKIEDRYSILVTQYALTADAYNFYTNMKKNTESLGSIFDAEPSEVNGNISCTTNPLEPVIGYVSVGATTSTRIFIDNRALPIWQTIIPYYNGCKLEFDWLGSPPQKCCYFDYYGENQVDTYINYDIGHYSNPFIPLDYLRDTPEGPPVGYTATTRPCADCTLRGTNIQPPFWR